MGLLFIMYVIYIGTEQKRYPKQWKIIVAFFVALGLKIGVNYTKKHVKEWWNEK